ncbi:hypothetical protein [Streptomyces beihaiensis]|uniref:Uncharacterized protein n=1 Tax=Streptomyces beihaiensis TaxID=2984495 RepID=A0ABT3U5C7_9ACTN|nr:hypothetical protein [Streptomyces beihaiensis]MCX3063415.1 hypothetical protein [Streptomyces beihaiensis]
MSEQSEQRNAEDEEFYSRDRPAHHPTLPEDRPRGNAGGPILPTLHHRGFWFTTAVVIGVILVIAVGIALFP